MTKNTKIEKICMALAAHLIKSMVKLKVFLETEKNRLWKQNRNKTAISSQRGRFKLSKIANLILF